ncbi:ribokinase [Alkalibaculum bacchi]|uniref:ribokinase n=1 Tax=Alkalibaculum bacchi TaxID=645887 RepID=UPI0026F24413|nr:ribokinase [Alkalibaculum bacchi]
MGSRIAVIGSYAVGMTISTERFPQEGETVKGKNFKAMHGGKGSNQAVAASRMGAEVLYGGCVGNDSFGDGAIKLYEEEGIDSSYIIRSRENQSTGVGLIYINAKGENEIVIDLAANFELSPADIDRMLPEISKCKLLLMQLEIHMDTVLYAAKKCKELGIPVVLNPAPYNQMPEELLKYCEFLVPNQTEARAILGLDEDSSLSDEEVAKQIHKLGVRNVIVTLGSEGALLVNDTMCKKIEGIPVDAIDTTGAGDTFNGSFCVALAKGHTIEDAIKFANISAGLAVTKYGVIEGIPTREEVIKIAESNI